MIAVSRGQRHGEGLPDRPMRKRAARAALWRLQRCRSRPFENDGPTIKTLVDRCEVFHRRLRQKGSRGHIGECGFLPEAGGSTVSTPSSRISSPRPKSRRCTTGAGGPAWSDYPLSIEPVDGADRPQMRVFAKYTSA
jgi:endoglucanase